MTQAYYPDALRCFSATIFSSRTPPNALVILKPTESLCPHDPASVKILVTNTNFFTPAALAAARRKKRRRRRRRRYTHKRKTIGVKEFRYEAKDH